jgi:cytochrome b involved in lipid metabolism
MKYITAVLLLVAGLGTVYWSFNMNGSDTTKEEVVASSTQDESVLTVSMTASVTPDNVAPANTQTTKIEEIKKDESKKVEVPAEKSFTLAEVQAKNSRESCYTTINGNVYDLTNWIDKHPGGTVMILFLCGKDGTNGFVGKHASSDRAKAALAKYKIGVLSQ